MRDDRLLFAGVVLFVVVMLFGVVQTCFGGGQLGTPSSARVELVLERLPCDTEVTLLINGNVVFSEKPVCSEG